jgi:hypothetical protein
MAIIRAAWDHVDIYTKMAKSCKRVAKALYALMLLIGVATAVVVTIAIMAKDPTCETGCENFAVDVDSCKAASCVTESLGSIPHVIGRDELQYIVLALSVASTLVASAVSYLNPAQRWQQLRGAALSLESEIWKFRTRVGVYAMTEKMSTYSREPERLLLAFQTDLAQQVSKSAGLLDTTIHARFKLLGKPSKRQLASFKHGQYKGAGTHGTFGASNKKRCAKSDDHHSPLHAAEYLDFRIVPAVDFYQGRLPRYYVSRTVSQCFMLLGTVSSMLLANFGIAEWAAIPTAVTTAITAWQEFQGTDKKMSRYSGSIEKLTQITIWWEQLSDVERANTSNLNRLMLSCEDVLKREREAWLSTSMATKMLAEGAEGDQKKKAETA